MNKFDLIELENDMMYKKNNLEKLMHGIIVEIGDFFSNVLFFKS